MKPRKWSITENVQLLFEPADLRVGFFWDRVKRKLYFLPVPCLGLVVQFRAPSIIQYMDSVPTAESVVRFPHCDERVLHSPGECIYCDMYPDAQQSRIARKVNFTGQSKPGFGPCPADAARGLGNAHMWHGNRPTNT